MVLMRHGVVPFTPCLHMVLMTNLQGTLQKFVDDTFQAILSMNRPVPIAVKYLFDFLDELAEKHGIEDPETLHIWKTNRYFPCCPLSLPLCGQSTEFQRHEDIMTG